MNLTDYDVPESHRSCTAARKQDMAPSRWARRPGQGDPPGLALHWALPRSRTTCRSCAWTSTGLDPDMFAIIQQASPGRGLAHHQMKPGPGRDA